MLANKPRVFSLSRTKNRNRKNPLINIIYFIVIGLFAIYTFKIMMITGRGLDQDMKDAQKASAKRCEAYYQSSYSGIVIEKLSVKSRTVNQFRLNTNEVIRPHFTWHQVKNIGMGDSVYKAPNSFTIDLFYGKNNTEHKRLTKYSESQTCR